MLRSLLRRSLLRLGALALAAPLARATWSIVVVDLETREVCVAAATCIANFDLDRRLPVIVVGQGAGVAQSLIDSNGVARAQMWQGIQAGATPDAILQSILAVITSPNQRQYGIVTLEHGPLTFTGTGCGLARNGVAGTSGSLVYAIQGNVLTGDAVVLAAEQALLATQGDLGQRALAAMEAAAALGGDGRCSCGVTPTVCGVPPPSFQYSAYTSFLKVARLGDADGTCSGGGCANGDYWCDLEVISNANGPEPIAELRARFEAWRVALGYVPDQQLTLVQPLADSLVADGRSQTAVLIRPRNLDGQPISVNSIHALEIVPLEPGPASALPGTPFWHGGGLDGLFGFPLYATDVPGVARFALTVRQGNERIRLWPDLELRVDPSSELHVGRDAFSAQAGGRVPITLNFGAGEAGRAYVLAASASGTSPGTPFGSAVLPLNVDLLYTLVEQHAGGLRLPGFVGALDAQGWASAQLVASPGLLQAWIGRRLDFAAGLLGAPERTTRAAGFVVGP